MENKNNEQQNLIIDEKFNEIFSKPTPFPFQEIAFNHRLVEIFKRHFNQDNEESQ